MVDCWCWLLLFVFVVVVACFFRAVVIASVELLCPPEIIGTSGNQVELSLPPFYPTGLYRCYYSDMPCVFNWCAVRVCVAACGFDYPPLRWLNMGNLLPKG